MLAEAAYASSTRATPRPCCVAANGPGRSPRRTPNGRTAFFALIAQGMALIFSARANPARASARPSRCSSAPTSSGGSAAAGLGRDGADLAARGRRRAGARRSAPSRHAQVRGRRPALRAALTSRSSRRPPIAGPRPKPAFTRRSAWPGRRASRPTSARPGRLAWLEARQGTVGREPAHAAEALSLARELGPGIREVWAIAALGD